MTFDLRFFPTRHRHVGGGAAASPLVLIGCSVSRVVPIHQVSDSGSNGPINTLVKVPFGACAGPPLK